MVNTKQVPFFSILLKSTDLKMCVKTFWRLPIHTGNYSFSCGLSGFVKTQIKIGQKRFLWTG